MKRSLLTSFLAAALLLGGSSVMFTACESDDYWPYNPPSGWGENYFYDSRLSGEWELVQANSQTVGTYDTNYMDFYGNGHGRYYYYSNSRPYSEDMAYFCQRSDSSTSKYQINVQYEDGSSSTMSYWFTDGDNSLWLQWMAGGQTVVYVYKRVSSIPW